MSGLTSRDTQPEDLLDAVEFIPGRLYYVPLRSKPHRQRGAAFFSVDDELVYWNFFKDFGPLNLGQLWRFCQIVNELLADPKLQEKRIYYYSGSGSQKRANAAFLICAYAMLHLRRSPEEAYAPFANVRPPFPPFHDATQHECLYKLSVLDCLRGVHQAHRHRLLDMNKFDVAEYEHFERVECGDLNWIVPDKFLAFAGPDERKLEYETLSPDFYVPYFKQKNVTLVIRLNRRCYDERRFERAGIKHLDLVYPDGTCPPDHILLRFLEVCEANKGAVAVHCKAGLGRTGTCIGAYIMKHFGFTAAETIGWLRVCRPGSIIGPQQQYMESIAPLMHRAGRESRAAHQQQQQQLSQHEHRRADDKVRVQARASGKATGGIAKGMRGLCEAFETFETKAQECDVVALASQGDFLRAQKAHTRFS